VEDGFLFLFMADNRTLVIVDDCAEDRKIYRRYLLKDPHQTYEIFEAKCAEDGLALCQTLTSDAILLDFCLPDMTGLEFLDRLQQQRSNSALPVIMLTGQGDEEIAVQAMKRGAQDYLPKGSLKPDMLQLAVRGVIKHASLQSQLCRTQDRQRLIAATMLQIRQSLDLEQILHTATVEVRHLLECDRVLVYQFDPAMSGKVVAESVISGWTSALGLTIRDTYFQQTKAQLYAEGEQRTIANIDTANVSACYLNLLKQFEVKAKLVMPILLNSKGESHPKLWGLLIAHQCSGERQWQSDEVELFHELSVQLAIAIQQAELLSQTQIALAKQKELTFFKSQIIATVSHEYRTPLSAILAAASTLKLHHNKLDESKQQKFLHLIEQKARHMSSLVDNMLLVQQLELDKATFKPLPIDLLQFFADLIEEQAISNERHELVYRVTGNPKGFWGDQGLLRQIFNNLASNAIKYSPEGGTVEFHLVAKEAQIIFSVTDQGIGIPLKDQETLFHSFSRASNVDTVAGTGLGLAITKACVELHGGTIALESQMGKGTKVTVILPHRST
jgi:signal transduction histidine kinase/DNA-binding response OmpR family regulator